MPTVTPDLSRLEPEVLKGLPDEATRQSEAARQLKYYEGEGGKLIRPREAESPADFERRNKLTTKLAGKVVRELAKGLYCPGPARKVKGGLDSRYQVAIGATNLNAMMALADRYAWLQGVFLLQVAPGGPGGVRLYPWRADEIAVWCRNDDPTDPWAVCTRSLFPDRRQVRYQLWSEVEVRTYWTKPGDTDDMPRLGSRQVDFDPTLSGNHRLGVLPFVSIPNEYPVDRYWVEGVGRVLADTCAVIDEGLSDLDQSRGVFCIPEKYGKNLGSAQQLLHVPGQIMQLIGTGIDKEPDIFFRQPDLQMEAIWYHLLAYANMTLQELDLPLQLSPETITHPESGVALMIRQKPLIDLWRARRPHFQAIEKRLASTILSVLGGFKVEVELDCEFPEIQLPMPTPERDSADEWELRMGCKSLIQIIQERYGLTRQQAIDRLKQVKEDRDLEESILGTAQQEQEQQPGAEPESEPSEDTDPDESEEDMIDG